MATDIAHDDAHSPDARFTAASAFARATVVAGWTDPVTAQRLSDAV